MTCNHWEIKNGFKITVFCWNFSVHAKISFPISLAYRLINFQKLKSPIQPLCHNQFQVKVNVSDLKKTYPWCKYLCVLLRKTRDRRWHRSFLLYSQVTVRRALPFIMKNRLVFSVLLLFNTHILHAPCWTATGFLNLCNLRTACSLEIPWRVGFPVSTGFLWAYNYNMPRF